MAVERVMSHWIDFSLLSYRPVIFNVGAGSGDFARQILREIVDRKTPSFRFTSRRSVNSRFSFILMSPDRTGETGLGA